MKRKLSCTTAFTLVEAIVAAGLLIVLAIITFHASRLVVEKSRSATCLAQIRQVAAQLLAYSYQNRGNLPQVYESGGKAPWAERLVEAGLLPSTALLSSARPADRSLLCPGSTARFDGKRDWMRANYGLNSDLAGAGTKPPTQPTPLTRLNAPSRTILLCDSGGYAINTYYVSAPNFAIWYLPGSKANSRVAWRADNRDDALHGRHGGKINVVFADGHAEVLTPEELKSEAHWLPR